jgi:hypothetical protein
LNSLPPLPSFLGIPFAALEETDELQGRWYVIACRSH